MTHEPWLAQLDAYLDGELDTGAMQKLDGHLRECSACTAESLRRRQWKRTIHTAGQRYVADSSLRKRVQKSISPRRVSSTWWRWPAFGALAAVLLVAAGFWTVQHKTRVVRQNQIVSELADLHVSTLASPTPVDVVSSDRHTVKPWFAGRIDYAPPVHDLTQEGFPLVGGRLDVIDGRKVAVLVYRHNQHRIALTLWPSSSPGNSAATVRQRDGFALAEWRHDGFDMHAVADLAPADMKAFATAVDGAVTADR